MYHRVNTRIILNVLLGSRSRWRLIPLRSSFIHRCADQERGGESERERGREKERGRPVGHRTKHSPDHAAYYLLGLWTIEVFSSVDMYVIMRSTRWSHKTSAETKRRTDFVDFFNLSTCLVNFRRFCTQINFTRCSQIISVSQHLKNIYSQHEFILRVLFFFILLILNSISNFYDFSYKQIWNNVKI